MRRSRKLRLTGLAATLLSGLGAAPGLAATVEDSAERTSDTLSVQLDGDLLTVQLTESTPLRSVLERIGEVTGAEVVVRHDPGEVGPLALRRLPVAEVVRRLAGSHSLAIQRTGTRDPGFDYETMVAGRIKRILLVGRGTTTLRTAARPVAHDAVPDSMAEHRRRVMGLAARRDPDAVATLAGDLESGSADPGVRLLLLDALAQIGTTPALAALGEYGLTDLDPDLRLHAAGKLATGLGPEAVPQLLAAAEIESEPEVRNALLRIAAGVRPGGRRRGFQAPRD